MKKTLQTKVWNTKTKAHELVYMDVEIDWNALAFYFGNKLVNSKLGRSKIQDGAIVATVVR